MRHFFRIGKMGVVAMLLLSLSACRKDFDSIKDYFKDKNQDDTPAITFYALGGGTMLDKFSTTSPEKVLNSATITGLQNGEKILAIDFRPATGQLYGVGSTSRIYVIDPKTGTERAVSGQSPNPTPAVPASFTPALSGNIVGFDFNPTVDRIRIVTSTGQNLRLNPETGTVVPMGVDGSINGKAGAMISAVAYDNNVAGAVETELYAIDFVGDKLFEIDPPNNGTLVEVGPLKLDVTGEGGFDIDYQSKVGLGLFEINKKSTLFTIDVETGKTKILAKYNKSYMYTGIAIPTRAVAYAVSTSNDLLIFNPHSPSSVVSKPITGIQMGETILGIDFRPVNGQLYAIGSTSSIYTINASSGVAAVIGALSTLPAGSTTAVPLSLSGTSFGFDFNPLVDRIRIVSNTGQNLRVNPNTAVALVDSMLNPGKPVVTAAAYENNFAGTTNTKLYVIDVDTDKLYEQNPPNAGTLVDVGSLGVNVEAANGYDIGGASNTGYALLTASSRIRLYTINPATGAATAKGAFAYSVNGFTVGLGF